MVKEDLNVCVVSPLYHPFLGGLGRQAQLLTEKLSNEGVRVFVIARRMKGMPPAEFNPRVPVYRAWSIKPYLYNYEGVNLVNIFTSLTFSLSSCYLLLKKRKDYDIVHFHGASLPLIINIPLLKLLGKKVIAKVAAAKVSVEAGSMRGCFFFLGNLIIRLLKKVDMFIAISAEIEENLKSDGISQNKIKRIANFIDFTQFFPLSAESKIGLKEKLGFRNVPLVMFSGRFIQRKGINFLLQAWKNVVKVSPESKLLLLGDGPMLQNMRNSASQLEIKDSVYFLGHTHQILDFLRASDIFVLPSLQEGMPNSLLEAMACGLPVVATRIGGVVDVVKDGENGVLVEPCNSQDIARGILKLLRDKEFARHIAFNAFCTIKNLYSLDSIAPKYIELYKGLSAA